ncbi:MAG TPA: hypothetical protein VHK88_00980 [Aquihabitans sp.]|jgi:hypothetical protein|nr:hypothetical protein [Aquihabitans sp.]
MTKLRRYALGALGAALLAGATVPAGAAPTQSAPDTYAAEAASSALLLSLFGQQLTIGATEADVTSPSSASARGRGALFVTQGFGESEASATAVGQADGSATPTCSPLALPPTVPFAALSSACSSAQAAVTADGSSSSATGQALALSLGGDEVLEPVVAQLPLDEVTGTLLTGLGPLLGQVTPVPPELIADQLSELLGEVLLGEVALLTIEAGEAQSRTSSDADSVDAATAATGATIALLDRGAPAGPILTIEVGESTTSVSRDRASGETAAEFSAIPVTVTVAADVAALLQLPQRTFSVPEGQQVALPLPAPLTSSITLSSGATSEIEGGATAQAAAVDIQLLTGVNGGVRLGLSAGSSSVVGALPVAPAPTAPPTTPPPAPAPAPTPVAPARTSLPRTGAEEQPLQAVALVLLLSAAGIGALVLRSSRRSRSARA